MRFQQLHHITAIGEDIERTHGFLHETLGLRRVKRTSNFDMPDSYHWYWGSGDGSPGTVVTYFERKGSPRVHPGPGQTDHYALAVAGDAELIEWRERLLAASLSVSPVTDRFYYKSVYTRDPDGQVVELATRTPGFTVDENESELGERLSLPPWLEADRGRFEPTFPPLTAHVPAR
jgi:glyoxalase family protein